MVDYGINGSFRVPITGYGSLEEVDGVEEFEQEVAIKLHYEMRDIAGRFLSQNNQRQKIRLAINRTAKDFDLIDEIRDVNISRTFNEDGEYEIEIVYYSNRNFSEVF